MNTDDIKAYLFVLGYGGHSFHVAGCLCRLEDQLEALAYSDKPHSRQALATLDLLRYRERLNGYLPVDHPQLRAATQQLANVLSMYLDVVGWADRVDTYEDNIPYDDYDEEYYVG